ncbi:hypothetical protein BU26DRAFT_563071 [Trematosphaeria pertusa]|uniref:Tat pathway signal sequence n=1 Tax=Trematosphaeria pertusa TaxID=390896 RepID=A0A6A6IL53_9PLEO|nr:uncharacterized protein BU26DRAFT_563071 [Trematosphaeria pertusa]KAF2251126.1 hypothetical protein BU26DRAFT_563071 [Trematosphaeria pertusa]
MSSTSTKYTLLDDGEEKSELPSSRKHRALRLSLLKQFYQVLLHLIVIVLIVIVRQSMARPALPACLLPSELPLAADAIRYETVVFDPSGFSSGNEKPNAFEGSPSPATNAAWAQLCDVGMFVLNAEEYKRLGRPTAELVDRPGEYLVTLEVMHQLHCLDYLRIASYAAAEGKHTHHEQENDWSKAKHLSHCINYLRQVLMCHGDLTPITLERKKGLPPYRPDFRITHTCRNWDRIHEFASSRNTSGYGIA